MKPSGDYTVHFSDPDIFFQWQDVLQVLIPRSSAITSSSASHAEEGLTSCPICLSPPTAPRMTKCGHVFCYPCILHYLNTSDIADKWIRCPICFDSINEKQLKSVKWFDNRSSTRSGHVNTASSVSELDFSSTTTNNRKSLWMRLMQRPQITTLALPRSATWPSGILSPHQAPFHFLPDVFTFSRFMLATPGYLLADIEQDLRELDSERNLLSSMKDELGIVFVEAAERKIHSQLEIARAMDTEVLRQAITKVQQDLDGLLKREEKVKTSQNSLYETEVPSDSQVPEELLSLAHSGFHPPGGTQHGAQRHQPRQPNASTTDYFYYQSASGSPIFLHPLDTRILLSHFNSYAAFPNELIVEVEAFSEGSVNEDLRKRCKYLALPEGADVIFVEANLEPVVGVDALKNFEAALNTRRSRRKEKAKRDDRAKLRAEEKEKERIYGNASQYALLNSTLPTSVTVPDDFAPARPTEPTRVENESLTQTDRISGAWGSRSFASALSSSHPSSTAAKEERIAEDEWDLDVAWHDMQQRSGRKRGRNQKLVILSGGASGARQRR
ncbi:hypothetical protein Clacol_007492 [Clathrus columnatus]|uniref:RING-type domain-containing protein n=1 Tax=Clathrus columnatus TaxID=1419009 RepID=A0AAV5AJX4_9AGAM|nr:hypothetical protein Clacol_007492 [Clathrus columnatus]